MQKQLFWFVDYLTEDKNITRDIFQTRYQAERFFKNNNGYEMGISEVLNYYKENNNTWNYEDFSDTFDDIITIIRDTKNSPYKK